MTASPNQNPNPNRRPHNMRSINNNNNSTSSGGIGFLGLLTVLFIGLKLTHYIDWSWWGVLAPIWFPFAIVGAGFGILVLGVLLAELFKMVWPKIFPPKKKR